MEINKFPSIGQLTEALSAAQGEFKSIAKKAVNPYFNSKYAPLDVVIEATREGLKKHGLAVMALPNGDTLTTILSHKSGEWISANTPLLADKKGPQGQGSAITYARRYALSAILNVASEEDDDGNLAQTQGDAKKPAAKKPAPKKPAPKKSLEEEYSDLAARAEDPEKWEKLGDWLKKQKAPQSLLELYEREKAMFMESVKDVDNFLKGVHDGN